MLGMLSFKNGENSHLAVLTVVASFGGWEVGRRGYCWDAGILGCSPLKMGNIWEEFPPPCVDGGCLIWRVGSGKECWECWDALL